MVAPSRHRLNLLLGDNVYCEVYISNDVKLLLDTMEKEQWGVDGAGANLYSTLINHI